MDPQGLCDAIPPAPKRNIDVCFLGRLSCLKGFHKFALVTGKLRARMSLLRIVTMGSPQLRAPPWVEHLGVVTERKKYKVLRRCKVFLFPSSRSKLLLIFMMLLLLYQIRDLVDKLINA